MKKILTLLAVFLTVASAAFADGSVCKNTTTGTEYTDIQSAVNAVKEGETIQLTADIDLTARITVYATIPAFTLDLNGHVLNGCHQVKIIMSYSGTFTITDSNPTAAHTDWNTTHTTADGYEDLSAITGGVLTGGKAMASNSNEIKNGGAIYLHGHSCLTVNGCTLIGNEAAEGGGAIYQDYGTFSLSGCNILKNKAQVGGGIHISNTRYGEITITNCTISGNKGESSGGGIYSYGAGSNDCVFTLDGCTITNNTAGANAAGVFEAILPIVIKNCTITGNNVTTSTGAGGGVFATLGANTTLSGKNIIKNNTRNGETDNLSIAPLAMDGTIWYPTPYLTKGADFDDASEIGINAVFLDSSYDESSDDFTETLSKYADKFFIGSTGTPATTVTEADLAAFTADNTDMVKQYNSNGYLELILPFDESTVTKDKLTSYKNGGGNVQIKRTFYKDGGNNTICLPFALDATALASSPLKGYTKLQEFSSATIKNKGQENETLELTMTNATAIEAGKPYIIAWASGDNLVNPTFEGVAITADEGSKSEASNGVQFCGTLVPYAMTANDKGHMFVGTGGQLNWPNVSSSLKGFRSYFTVDLLSAGAKFGMPAFLVDDANETTGVSNINADLDTARAKKLLEAGKVVIISNGKRYGLNGVEIKD